MIGNHQLGIRNWEKVIGMVVAGGSTCFPGLGDDVGVFQGSCEKRARQGVSYGAGGN
jgi:hypothetical protein